MHKLISIGILLTIRNTKTFDANGIFQAILAFVLVFGLFALIGILTSPNEPKPTKIFDGRYFIVKRTDYRTNEGNKYPYLKINSYRLDKSVGYNQTKNLSGILSRVDINDIPDNFKKEIINGKTVIERIYLKGKYANNDSEWYIHDESWDHIDI